MPKSFFPITLCGMLLSACASGFALDRPAVEGKTTDARTHRPISGACVTLIKLEEKFPAKIVWEKPADPANNEPGRTVEDSTKERLSSAFSNAQGCFSLEARYKLGLVLLYGDPLDSPVIVRISRDGYQTVDIQESYNFSVRPFEPIHLSAALLSNAPPARKRS